MEERLTSAQLLEYAEAAGFAVSERKLEDWRYRGLLPRPERAGNRGRTPRWLYPPETADQLVALCRWRQKTKDLEAIRVGLWVEGFAVEDQAVRDAIVDVLSGMREKVEEALSTGQGEQSSPDEALAELTYRAAGTHGDKPGPRTVRMRRADRATGLAFLFRLFMGHDLEQHLPDAKFAEQAMGISAGRRGAPPYRWLDGPPEELANLAPLISLPALIEAARTATTDELARARKLARAFVQGLPLVALFAEAVLGPRAGGLAAAKNLSDTGPELFCMLVPCLASAGRSGYSENLDTLEAALGAVTDLGTTVADLGSISAEEREGRIKAASAEERPTVRRALTLAQERQTKAQLTRRAKPPPK